MLNILFILYFNKNKIKIFKKSIEKGQVSRNKKLDSHA
jgi:hypothetical protein